MRTIMFMVFVLFILTRCKKKTTINEIPAGIIHTGASPSVYNKVLNLFPPSYNNELRDSVFFGDTVQKKIILIAESEVFLTFVYKKAYFDNTIGWYSYDKSSVPQNSSEINKQFLFPNASALGSGGGLSLGDMLKVGSGKFKAGTVIGFFLISNGWKHNNIDWSQPVLYTDYLWNAGQYQQHILYNDTSNNKIVLSWEDTPVNLSDSDFDDVIFCVTDSTQGTKPFDLKSMIKE